MQNAEFKMQNFGTLARCCLYIASRKTSNHSRVRACPYRESTNKVAVMRRRVEQATAFLSYAKQYNQRVSVPIITHYAL